MNREIKFRAWHTVEGKYLFDYETMGGFSLIGETVLFGYFDKVKTADLQHLVTEQYTGLKDKNGVEIYEGDVLQYFASGLLNWVVVFRDGCFGVQNIHIDGTTNYNEFWRINSPYFFTDREVIGNIYQNPELIKTA